MPIEKKIPKELELAQDLSNEGYTDVLVLTADTASQVLTEKRQELMQLIKEERAESVRDLARRAGRDVSVVSKDLKLLFRKDVVEFEREKGRKKPVLKHRNIFVEPIVYQKSG